MLLYVVESLNMDTYFSNIRDLIVQNKLVSGLAIACGVGTTLFVARKLRGKRKRVCGKDYPPNTVILHVGPSKSSYVPSLGHFCVKLQTYLNITKIPYQVCYKNIPGPKKKVPWIEYNGMTLGDSQLIIEYLNKEFNVDLNRTLTKEQRAESWAIQKWLEEFTYWLNVYTRWYILQDDQFSQGYADGIPPYTRQLFKFFRGKIKANMSIIGIGRHSDQEVFDMMVFDLRQLSAILGNKKYFMGGDSPTELDCAAFGQLAQIRWATLDTCPGKQVFMGELTNLMEYTDRIKERYWPDWNELILKPQKTTVN